MPLLYQEQCNGATFGGKRQHGLIFPAFGVQDDEPRYLFGRKNAGSQESALGKIRARPDFGP
jgi:hypothetical protein